MLIKNKQIELCSLFDLNFEIISLKSLFIIIHLNTSMTDIYHSNNGGIDVTGWMKKKGKIFGIWKKYYVELHQTDLYIRKDDETSKLNHHYTITPDTKVIIKENSKLYHLVIKIPNQKPINLSADSQETLEKWVVAIRSATFHGTCFSMSQFNIISVIGRGAFGKVLLVQKKDSGEYYALKTVKKEKLLESRQIHTILAEREILGKVRHKFIVNLLFAFQTASKFYIGMEYETGGDLCGLMTRQGSLPIEDVRIYTAEIALALEYLHSMNIIFRDVKPDNILITRDGHLKLSDFGLSKDLTEVGSTSTFCGTLEYMAPEILSRKPYDFAIDWWALGVVVYQMIFGAFPFSGSTRSDKQSKITNSEVTFPENTSDVVKDFINRLLNKKPSERATYSSLENHQFFAGLTRDDVLSKKYSPSFVPRIRKTISTEYFDNCFTSDIARDSFSTPMLGPGNVFEGFSFIDEHVINTSSCESSETLDQPINEDFK